MASIKVTFIEAEPAELALADDPDKFVEFAGNVRARAKENAETVIHVATDFVTPRQYDDAYIAEVKSAAGEYAAAVNRVLDNADLVPAARLREAVRLNNLIYTLYHELTGTSHS